MLGIYFKLLLVSVTAKMIELHSIIFTKKLSSESSKSISKAGGKLQKYCFFVSKNLLDLLFHDSHGIVL